MVRLRMASVLFLLLALLHQNPDLCASLDGEGRALLKFKERVEVDPFGSLANWGDDGCGVDPCSWFGVECSDDGRVIALNLKDLCLKGTLTPELGNLIHMKSLVLNNNSFYGTIPGELGYMQKLQVLDLGHTNLRGPLPPDLGKISSLEILVLGSNKLVSPDQLHDLNVLSELQVDDELLSSNSQYVSRNINDGTVRRLLRGTNQTSRARSPSPSPSPLTRTAIHLRHRRGPHSRNIVKPSPPPSEASPSPAPESISTRSGDLQPNSPASVSSPSEDGGASLEKKHNSSWPIYVSVGGGVFSLIALSAVYLFCFRANKFATVMPWSTGLSGQLQKALVTGVPSLKRSELERACENFSNVIDSSSDCMLYKGTLSNGVEIAVTSSMTTTAKDWSDQSEAQFRKKISILSKVNHKNFMNLLGYCGEEEPFARMMVFEYAPNGTLFEHLHIREAEHLNWAARLRIAMGIAYCLEHMDQLNPPVAVSSLHSSSIYLTDDYAAKVSDFEFLDHETESEAADGSPSQSIVYKFGIILLELISGRRPFSKDDGLLVLWASGYLTGERPLRDMVDSTLESFSEEDVAALCELIRPCIDTDPRLRPGMAEVVERLRKITAMAADGAMPKLSPLWWAELEIISAETS